MFKTKKLLIFIIPFLLLLCSCGDLNENSSLWEVIGTLFLWIFIIAAIDTILDMMINFFALRFPYIYFPICLVFSLLLFFNPTVHLFNLNWGFMIGHAILLFLMIPRPDDFLEHYTRITYQYDLTLGDFFESERKDIKHTISGACVKLAIVAILLCVFYLIPFFFFDKNDVMYQNWLLYAPLIVEAGFSGIYSLLGIYRLIRYHG